MSEVSRLQSSEARLEGRLAALSAAPSAVAASVEVQMRSAQVDGRPSDPQANVFQSSMEQRLESMMAAIQCLSDRMIHYEMVRIAVQSTPITTAALHSLQVRSI